MKKESNPPSLFLRFFRWYCHPKLKDHIEGDLIEVYNEWVKTSGKRIADRKFIIDVLLLFRPGIIRPVEGYKNVNQYTMYKSYFKIGWRNLLRNKGYSLIKLILLAILFFGCICCDKAVNSNSRVGTNDLETIISQFENELKSDLTEDSINGSISAAIVNENKVIWSKAFGYADRENKILADTATIYRTGSISKSFTAFLMMQLVEEGIIKLSDPVELYFPEVKKLQGYSDSTKITFLQLASHTSGLTMEPALKNANKGSIDEWERKLIASIATTSFESRPGTKFNYSNIGYGILGLALSRATDRPFMQLVQEKIFVPLKMKRSFYIVPDEFKTKLAVGMEGGPSEKIDTETPKEEHQGRGYKVPNGGIYSTPNDLAKFMISNLGYVPLLKKESMEIMQTKKGPVANNYGLGFIIVHSDTITMVGHGGRVPGYTAMFAFEKENGFGVVLMRNYSSGATELGEAALVLLSKLRRLKK